MKTLTKKQFKIIDQLWMDRLDSGQLENDYDELKDIISAMGDFEGVEDEATIYYLLLCNS